MSNLLRVELFKLIRNTVFWVLVGIVTVISFVVVLIIYLDENGILEQIEGVDISVKNEGLSISGMTLLTETIQSPDLFSAILLVSILGAFFIATENATGVIKNLVSIGNRRYQIYISKAIIFTIGSVVLVLSFAIIPAIFASLFFGVGELPSTETLWTIGKVMMLTCLYVLSFGSIVMVFSMIAKGSGIASLLSVGFYLLVHSGLTLSAQRFKLFDTLNDYSVYNRFTEMTENKLAFSDMMELAVIPLATSLVFIVAGLLIFQKKDIQ